MTLDNPAVLIGAAATLLLLVVLVWTGTRSLPPVGKWLARSLMVLAVGLPVALAIMLPLEGRAPTQTAERVPLPKPGTGSGTAATPSDAMTEARRRREQLERDARVRADEARRRAELQRRRTEDEAARRQVDALESRKPDGAAPTETAPTAPGASETTSRGVGTTRSAAPASDAKWDVVPVFYGTDRNREREDATRVLYGADRAKRLELGRALVTVPKVHETPQIERPWVYKLPFTSVTIYQEAEDPEKHFTLRRVQSMTRSQLLAIVRERLRNSASFKDHALVFVHGFNTSFDFALYRSAQIAYDLKFDGAPFVYSWPSQGKVLSYSYDRESAQQAEPYLEDFMKMVVNETGAKVVSVIAHSMGNQVLLPVLRDLKQQMPAGVQLSQVILAAPDVDRDGFENLAREIKGVSKGITLYAHANDRALDISKQFWGGIPRAGDVPAGGPIILPGIMDTIDVTETSTEIFNLHHSGYAENKALLNDIQLLLQTGERPPEKRIPILQRITTPKGDYWKYPVGQ